MALLRTLAMRGPRPRRTAILGLVVLLAIGSLSWSGTLTQRHRGAPEDSAGPAVGWTAPQLPAINVASATTASSADNSQTPAYCSGMHPAEMFPLRPLERARNLACSDSILGPLPPGLTLTSPAGTSSTAYPPGFGIYNLQLTYDSADGYLLLFGATGVGSLNGTQTWSFSGGVWSDVKPIQSPESCYGSSLAYDDVDRYVVYFGGGNIGGGNCTSADQTWSYKAGTWTQLHPTTSPSPRLAAAFTNDSADGYLLLFGGTNATCAMVCNDTWSFVGGQWFRLAPTASPPARAGAGMTYDAADGYVVMFGGTTTVSSLINRYFWVLMLNDTWAYKSGVWSQLRPVGAVPPEPYDDGLVFDRSDNYSLYTVADNNATGCCGDPEIYWSFSAGNWTSYDSLAQANKSLPANRLAEALAYDWRDGYAVLFGGTSATWTRLDDTWAYHAGRWTNITEFSGFLSASPNPTEVGVNTVLTTTVIGGGNPPFGFAYAGLPSGCTSTDAPTLACTPLSSGAFTLTVNITNSTGSFVLTSEMLVVKSALSITGFAAYPSTIPLGGSTTFEVNASGGLPPYPYVSYPVLPPGCRAANTVNLSCTPTASGGFTVEVAIMDSIGGTAYGNTTLVVTLPGGGFTLYLFEALPNTIVLGSSTTFFVSVNGGTAPYSYQYGGVPPGCTATNSASWKCMPGSSGTYAVTVTVTDAQGLSVQGQTSLVVRASGPSSIGPLSILAFFASPSLISLGSDVALEVFTFGGVPPFAFSYSSLPPGCQSASTAFLSCTPTQAGNYTVTVRVSDSTGNSSSAVAPLDVGPKPAGGAPASAETPIAVAAVAASGAAIAISVITLKMRAPRMPRPPQV